MKRKVLNICLFTIALLMITKKAFSQELVAEFGKAISLASVLEHKMEDAETIKWYQVNTDEDTWWMEGEVLKSTGLPIGVIRSEKEYENFIMHIEWSHQEAGGNSGAFIWSDAKPRNNRLPSGVEVQMLDLEWVKINTRDGVEPPIAYVHGELFGVGNVEITPENPRGKRSMSRENRVLGKKEWNTYEIVCVDGNIKLSVNGKFVNGITNATKKKGYICLEAEGAEVHFRNIQIIELD